MDIATFIINLEGATIFLGFIALMAAILVASVVAVIVGLFAFVVLISIMTSIFGEKKVLNFVFVAFPLAGSAVLIGGPIITGAFVIAFVAIWILATFLSLLSSGGFGGLIATIGGVFMTIMGFVTTGLMAIVGLAVIIIGLVLTYRIVQTVLGWIFSRKATVPATT